ncbi:MAG: AAA family ATPase [Dermatophilaceae bacterium]
MRANQTEAVVGRTFVGRVKELAVLHDKMRRATDGHPGTVLVGGEAGIGKSRLIEEFEAHVVAAGAVAAVGGAAPLTRGALPYAPLIQALRILTVHAPSEAVDGERDELARLLTELTDLADSSTGARSDWMPETGRGRLFGLLSGLLERFSRAAPLVLVLEDLHWADTATLDFLAFMQRNPRGERVLVVASYRADEPGDWLPVWLAEARRVRSVTWVDLPRLTHSELSALLVGLGSGPVDDRIVDLVFDRSEGNPFFAEELFATGIGASPELPRPLAEVLLARVRRLSQPAQRVLRLAAVAGRWVCHEPLVAVAGTEEEALTEALRELIDRGLLLRSTELGTHEVYRFRHALLQEAVYAQLLPGERIRLHAGYASAFARQLAERPDEAAQLAAALAEHWHRAGQPADALDWSLRAADNADRVYAHAEAAQHCERVLALWDDVPDAPSRTRIDQVGLHIRAARAWEYAGDEARARPHIDEALARVDPDADPVRAGLLHELRGWYDIGPDHQDVVLAEHREAVRLVPPEPPSAERAQVLWAYGRALLIRRGRHPEASATCQQALAAARGAGSQPHIIRAMASVGYLQALDGELAEGLTLLREACAAAEPLPGDPWGLAFAHTLLSDTLLKANRLDEAAEVAIRGYTLLRRLGLCDYRPAFMLVGTAIEALFGQGRWDEAAATSEQLTSQPVSPANTFAHVNVAELDGARGHAEAALARLNQLSEVPARFSRKWTLELRQRRAELELWMGRPRAAMHEATQVLDTIADSDHEQFAGWLLCLGMRALADVAELGRARQDPTVTEDARRHALQLTDRLSGMAHDPFLAGPLRVTAPAERDLWAAERSRLDGSPDPAVWQAAVAAWQDLGRPYRAAYSQWRQAEAVLARGAGPGEAAAPLRAAHATAVRLDAGPLRTEIESLARRARVSLTSEGPGPAPAPPPPHGLTDREIAVLQLLAVGHTNREIGQRLFISPKTASVHITNILRKLSVRDRVQAATAAVRLGLVDPSLPPESLSLADGRRQTS